MLLANTRFSNTVSLSTNIKGDVCLPSLLKMLFQKNETKNVEVWKVISCIMSKDMPNFSHTFSIVVETLVVSHFENVVSAGLVKTYILLQVIPQIAASVLWFSSFKTFCGNQRQSVKPSFLSQTVPSQSYLYSKNVIDVIW